ncbi:MAG: type II secretion system secretin GspD [Pseudomonadaceae bacterium]|nr:type II secretion system secretin GspD [Pseudomonadaceae bacterium]
MLIYPAKIIALALSLLLLAPLLTCSPAQAAQSPSSSEEERWTINMRDADIADFVEQVASISGQTLILDPRIKGQVSVISQAPLNLTEVYQLFLSVMSTHGYSVLTEGEQARIVPNAEAKTENNSNSNLSGPDSLETRLLQVQQTPVAELIPLIRPLLPQYAHLAAVASSNALIISDRRSNIERVQELISQLDRASESDYSVYDMRNGWVQDAAVALNASLKQGQAQGSGNTQVIADGRSNRLIFLGPPQARERLLKLAQSLDTPTSRSANTRVIRLRNGDAKSMAITLGQISENLKPAGSNEAGGKPQPLIIRADESINALVLLAEPDMVTLLEDLVRQLDVPRAQVLVEAAIVEMSGDISDALGVQWAIGAGGDAIGGVNFNNTGLSVGTLLGAIKTGVPPTSLPDGAIVGVGNDNFGALITALSANSNSNLLSTPSLLTLDNQKAEILVGQNVPFQTGSYTTGAAGASNPFTTIERQDVGVSLKVTPHINEGATLRLEIEQEISSIAPTVSRDSKAVDLVTNKRKIKSTVLADNGQVIVLGGLIQDDSTQSDSKVPLLGDIPLIGGLFRSSKEVKIKRNLMVFIRPSVVRDAAGLHNLSQQKYQDIRVLDGANEGLSPLPINPQQLFDRGASAAPELDLRPAPNRAQAYPAPSQTVLEKPKSVDPATLGNGRGGDESRPARPTPPRVPVVANVPVVSSTGALPRPNKPAQRYGIELLNGSNEAYMQALLKQHPSQPLHLAREQRDGQPWFRMLYGNYPDQPLAERVLRTLPSALPQRSAKVVPL